MSLLGITLDAVALQCLGILCIPFVLGIVYNFCFRKSK
jgi:hypothetical protein